MKDIFRIFIQRDMFVGLLQSAIFQVPQSQIKA